MYVSFIFIDFHFKDVNSCYFILCNEFLKSHVFFLIFLAVNCTFLYIVRNILQTDYLTYFFPPEGNIISFLHSNTINDNTHIWYHTVTFDSSRWLKFCSYNFSRHVIRMYFEISTVLSRRFFNVLVICKKFFSDYNKIPGTELVVTWGDWSVCRNAGLHVDPKRKHVYFVANKYHPADTNLYVFYKFLYYLLAVCFIRLSFFLDRYIMHGLLTTVFRCVASFANSVTAASEARILSQEGSSYRLVPLRFLAACVVQPYGHLKNAVLRSSDLSSPII